MIAEFVKCLEKVGLTLREGDPTAPTSAPTAGMTGREIAEAMYLALHVTHVRAAVPTEETAETQTAEQASNTKTETDLSAPVNPPESAPAAAPKPQSGDLFAAGNRNATTGGVSAQPFRAAAAIALPGATELSRALRPLLQKFPSRTRREIDVERTVQQIADGGPYAAVERPVRERWLEVALVMDEGASMRVWRPTVVELQRLLERHGAFRDVTVWGIHTDDGNARFYRETGLAAPPTRLANPKELLDPSGRRLIVVVSDCIGHGWHSGAAFRLLADWGARNPTVLIQVLPRRLWAGTALPLSEVGLHSLVPGAPNRRLQPQHGWQTDSTELSGVPLPVVTLEDWTMAPWAAMLAARGSATASGVLINDLLIAPKSAPDEAKDETKKESKEPIKTSVLAEEQAKKIVSRFRASASPTAFRLACYLAAVELIFPVMRLVQQAMLPQSRQIHLAEVFLGGLLRQPVPKTGEAQPVNEIFYDFHPGVRELLLRLMPKSEVKRVVTEVWRLIEQRLPFAQDFEVLLTRPDSASQQKVEIGRRAFATISQDALLKITEGRSIQVIPPEPNSSEIPIIPGTVAPGTVAPGTVPNDPWKDVFGGLSERNHRQLSAVVEPLAWNSSHDPLEDWFSLRLTVRSMELKQHPLRGSVQFFLHDSFVGNPTPRVLAATDGSYATYETAGWGAFTAGALADDGQTRLELDLSEHADLPYEFRNPLKELIARAITQNSELAKAELVELEEHVKKLIDSRRTQSQVAIFQALFNLGQALAESGAYQFASEFYEHARLAARQTNNRVNEETVLDALGTAKHCLGDLAGARECYGQMAAIVREYRDEKTEARALLNLARLAEQQGQQELAIQEAEAALALFQQVQTSPTPEWQQARELLARLRPVLLSEFTFQTVTLTASGRIKQQRTLTARQFVEDLGQGVGLEMVEIPGGKFLMGTSEKDKERVKKEYTRYWGKESAERWVNSEMPQHEVSLESFYIGKFTITQQQWRLVAGWEKVERDLDPNPSHFKDKKDSDDRPVEQVSWEDAQEFCARLSQKTGRAYRLPSEAEWEYACRAGTATPFAFGETITHEVVNYDSQRPYAKAKTLSSRGETIPVGSLGVANAFGVFDMHGNVWEWCEDAWHSNYVDAPMDGSAWLSGGDSSYRVLRGGSWSGNGYYCRSADRNRLEPGIRSYYYGFRVVVSARTSFP